jgi:hypothetical protein
MLGIIEAVGYRAIGSASKKCLSSFGFTLNPITIQQSLNPSTIKVSTHRVEAHPDLLPEYAIPCSSKRRGNSSATIPAFRLIATISLP